MEYSNFGHHYAGYSGITHLMDDLNEGLSADSMIMLGGGNPASIPAVHDRFNLIIEQLQKSGKLLSALTNYDSPQGNTEFLENLATFFKERYGWAIDRKNIALTHGSQSSFFILFNTFAGKAGSSDKKILIPLVPEYIGYCDVGIEEQMIVSQQARIKHLQDRLFKYEVDFDRMQIDRTTGLICVSRPTNPSGNVITDVECEKLDRIAGASNVPLLIDCAYGSPFPEITFTRVNPFWNENTIVCMSLSKLGLPGVRTGIVIANSDIIKYFSNMTAITSLAPAGIGAAIVNQLIRQDDLLPLCQQIIQPFYEARARFALEMLQQAIDHPGFHVHKPEGAIFLWLWFDGLKITTDELYSELKKEGLLIVPGKYFFPGQQEISRHAESCIRMNYVQSEEELTRAAEILARVLNRYWP